MRKFSYKYYLLLALALFCLLSLPTLFVEGLRKKIVSAFRHGDNKKELTSLEERLEVENHLLRIEVSKLRAFLEQSNAFEKSFKEIESLRQFAQAVPAQVIYRDPVSWNSTLWINLGEETNRELKRKIIAKNSPVVLGRSVVGVIDSVGPKHARVRLITDSALHPAVRAVRGSFQNGALIEHIDALVRSLSLRSDLGVSEGEQKMLVKSLENAKANLIQGQEEWHLAKGTLQGSGAPLWRRSGAVLKGIGFNYDFSDSKGSARDLRTGKSMNPNLLAPETPIIKVNDLLVTTGMDGVFPAGLRVAEVTKVFPLKEGGYQYEIEAKPSVGNLDELQVVFVLPSMNFEIKG